MWNAQAVSNMKGRTKPWLANIAEWRSEWEKFTKPNFEVHASPMRPERVVADCRAVLPDDAILCCDVGINHNWFMQFWRSRRPQSMLNSWGLLRHGLWRRRRAGREARGTR